MAENIEKIVWWSEIAEFNKIEVLELPLRAQKKIKRFEDVRNSKAIAYRKYDKKAGTSEPTEKALKELEELNEDIIDLIADYINVKTAAEEKARLEQEEAEKIAKEKEEEEKRMAEQQKQEEEDAKSGQTGENGGSGQNNEGDESEEDDGPFSFFGL